MECPICHQTMEVYVSRTTRSKEGKEYDHKRYRCRTDDVWGQLEVPKQLAKIVSVNKASE